MPWPKGVPNGLSAWSEPPGAILAPPFWLWSHQLWGRKRFSERECYLWLVSHAARRPIVVRSARRNRRIEAGQLLTTLGNLATHWHMPRSTVKVVLDGLADRGIVERQSSGLGTLVTIPGYRSEDGVVWVEMSGDMPVDTAVDKWGVKDWGGTPTG